MNNDCVAYAMHAARWKCLQQRHDDCLHKNWPHMLSRPVDSRLAMYMQTLGLLQHEARVTAMLAVHRHALTWKRNSAWLRGVI